MEEGWNEYEKHVLFELKRLGDGQDTMKKDINTIATNLATTQMELKIKAGIWGAIGAMVPTVIALIFIFMRLV